MNLQTTSNDGKAGRREEEFPAGESWWPATDTRAEWSSAVPVSSKPSKRIHRSETEMDNRRNMLEQTPQEKHEETQCEIRIESRKVFFSASAEITGEPRSCVDEERRIVPTSGRPMVIHVNCSVEQFENLGSQFTDVFRVMDHPRPGIPLTAMLTRTIRKTLSKLANGQHELHTEYRYSFPSSANIVFRVGTSSDTEPVC